MIFFDLKWCIPFCIYELLFMTYELWIVSVYYCRVLTIAFQCSLSCLALTFYFTNNLGQWLLKRFYLKPCIEYFTSSTFFLSLSCLAARKRVHWHYKAIACGYASLCISSWFTTSLNWFALIKLNHLKIRIISMWFKMQRVVFYFKSHAPFDFDLNPLNYNAVNNIWFRLKIKYNE